MTTIDFCILKNLVNETNRETKSYHKDKNYDKIKGHHCVANFGLTISHNIHVLKTLLPKVDI